MKALFDFLKARINSKLPQIKTVEMWRGQTTRERIDKKQNPYRTPAIFIEFIVDDVKSYSLGIKRVDLTIRFRFAMQHMTFERLDDLDFQDNFDEFIQTLRGNPNDSVQFSSLCEVLTDLDEEFDNVNEPYIDYTTVYTKTSAYTRKTDSIRVGVEPDITVTQLHE